MKTATFTKLKSGNWGIRVPLTNGTELAAGDTVRVVKKSGEGKDVVVDRVLWKGTDKRSGNPVALCAIVDDRRNGSKGHFAAGMYCYGICPVGRFRCSPENGPCHDCE